MTNSQLASPAKEGRAGESRRRLLAAARQLFVERGYHDTRPQDIAKLAGLGYGTFYLHFADKRRCFLAFVDEARRELESEIDQAVARGRDLEERTRLMLDASWRYAERNPGVIGAALTDLRVIARESAPSETLTERWAKRWASVLSEGMAAGAFHRDYDAAIIGHAIIGLILEAGAFAERQHLGKEELIDNLTLFLVRALAPQAGDGATP